MVKPNERATLFYTTVGPDRSRNVGNMCTNSFTPLTTRSPVPTPPTAVSLSCHSGPRLQAVRSSTPTQQNDSRSSSSSCTATQLQCGSTLSLSLSLSLRHGTTFLLQMAHPWKIMLLITVTSSVFQRNLQYSLCR